MVKFRVVNVEVKLREGESEDRLIKRFLKKCKKSEIIKEYREKTEFFRTRSQKRRDKRLKNKFLRMKESESLDF